jgi:hypothetical protein
MNFRQLFENKTPVTDYGTWRDEINARGGEIHPQQDRNRLVAQSWDGEIIGEFNLRTNQGYITPGQTINEFDAGEGGFGPFKLYAGDAHKYHHVDTFDSLDDAIEEVRFLIDTDSNLITSYWKIVDGTGEQVWDQDPDSMYDTMRSASKMQYKKPGNKGMTENTTPDDEKVIELFAQIVADDTGYSVKKVNYEIYDEGLRTPSGIPVYFYSFDGDVRYIGVLPGGKPTAIVNQDGEVGGRGSYLELSIGGKVQYVIKGKTLYSAADQQKIANAKPGDDEYSLVLIALDLMWGRMQHKFMEQGVAEGSDDGYGYKSLSTEQIMKLIKSGNWEAVQDVVPGKHIQLRNNRNGKSTTIHVKQDVDEGLKSKIAGAALAAANLLGSPAQAAEEPVKPITIAYVQIDGEVRKYNLGDKFSSAKEAEQFISGVLDKQGISGYTLDIKHGYPKQKQSVDENLRDWFKEKWVRFGPDGKIRGDCARGSESEGKPKCLPQAKAHALGKKGRASAAARKRKEDPNANRTGAAINVATKKKTNEVQLDEKCWDTHKQVGMKKKSGRMVPNCVPRESVEQSEMCPECGGAMYSEAMINEKKDACYYKVKASAKVWPSAYASGRLVQCRKRGSANYGKKSESKIPEDANMSQAAVRKLQNMLNMKGANLDVDGVMGPLTTKSVEKYLPAVAKRLAPDPSRTTGVQGQKPKHKDIAEGFDELDAYIKAKQAPQPSGGAGIKRGSYGMPGRKTTKGVPGARPGGGSTGHTTPGNRDFGRPHSIPRAAPRGIDDYDANYRREVDEVEYKDTVDKSKIPAVQRKAQGGDWKVSTKDLEHERSKSPTGPEGLAKAKQRLGMNENQQLPPEVIELLKKVAQSDAAPEHKKAIINSIMAKYQPIKNIAEEPTRTAREKFNQGLKRAGFDPDAAAKRLTDLIAKQKAEREQFEKENPAAYGDTSKAPK